MDILFDSAVSSLPMTYDALAAQQKVMIETAKVMYMFEKTGDTEILQEGFMDIVESIKESVLRLIEKVRNAIKQMLMRLNSRAMSYKKLVEKYREDLYGANIKSFEIEGYQFRLGTDSRPDVTSVHDIYLKYNDQIMIFDRLSPEKVREICDNIISEHALNSMRTRLLTGENSWGGVRQSKLKDTSFQYYRNGSTEVGKMTITQKDIDEILLGYTAVIDERKFTLSQQTEVNKLLNDMESFFKHVVPKKVKDTSSYTVSTYNGPEASTTLGTPQLTNIADFQTFVNAKYRQTVEMANAVATVFTERVAAIDNMMKQNEFIIRQALDYKGQGKTVNETMKLYDSYTTYPATVNENWTGVWEGCNLVGRNI